MTKNLFLASCAKAAFALAAVVMMSTVFTSCSKDNDDEPKPSPKAGTVTIDGAEKPILKAEYKDKADGNYILYFYLSDDHKEKVIMQLNKDLHMTGHAFNLTEREKEHAGFCWVVEYYKPDGTQLIDTYGAPGEDDYPVFKIGTLTISGSPDGTLNIKLENGRVEGTDGKEHTLTISYSGTMEKYGAPLPEPKANTVTLDGAEKPIVKAEYEDHTDGNYRLFLNLSADGKEKVEIDLNKDLHMNGSPVDLTKREKKHEGDEWYWAADYHNPDNSLFTNTYGDPDSNSDLYLTGTLTVSGSPTGTINIKLENGRVKTNDRQKRTLTISYSGTMTERE
ncbi:hypothetical protein HMPREF9140_00289 [Prevotella micans F0438]|uniref:Lipocalin-like domain-containing protein n=1 Tax=Prevotella micans F0438 TaxID=883158 RepID=H1Q051_9BACT|nr:hypothetical protein [Prevotella micans]EHO74128.1 hypothetical protein HMPREF9140_00289 [Prevotella micans F0438]